MFRVRLKNRTTYGSFLQQFMHFGRLPTLPLLKLMQVMACADCCTIILNWRTNYKILILKTGSFSGFMRLDFDESYESNLIAINSQRCYWTNCLVSNRLKSRKCAAAIKFTSLVLASPNIARLLQLGYHKQPSWGHFACPHFASNLAVWVILNL